MRPILIFLSLLLFGACVPPTVVVSSAPYAPPRPGYVYAYSGRGCWADNVWYPSCPWSRLRAGYYRYHRGHYYHYPKYRWTYRPHRPPPRIWLSAPPSGPRYVPPRRHYDHPRYRPPRAPARGHRR